MTAECISGYLIPSRALLEGVHNVQVLHASVGKSHQESLLYFYFHFDFLCMCTVRVTELNMYSVKDVV